MCPFHEDENPSLNINGESGQYYCHGCGKKGDLFHFYGKINGLNTGRDFGKILKGIAADHGIEIEQQKKRIIAEYDYTNESGEIVFQVVRFDPKSFAQRHRNGNGWKWGLKGIEPVLYQLPEIHKAQEIILVEGEKDADNLNRLGFTATTCAMGAKKWRDSYTDALVGKDVVLIPDNDKAGQEHMEQVGAALSGRAKSLKLLKLDGLSAGGDVSDWLEQFQGDREAAFERLSMMIEGAPPYSPPKPATIEDVVIEAGEFSRIELPEKKRLLGPWLTGQTITLISGWRGVGKSWFAMGVVNAVATGESFGPWEAGEPVPCLYLEGEMTAQDIQERFDALGNGKEKKAPLYVYSDAYANGLGIARANLLSDSWRQKTTRILKTRGIKLWVIDNLASLTPGLDENKKADWDPVNQWLLELRFAGISTVMVHHVGKGGTQRGTSAREDNLDTSITLKPPHDYVPEDGARFICCFRKSRVRAKDLHTVADTSFKLEQDQSGRLTWTTCGVRRETRAEILRLLDEGNNQVETADTLGIDKSYVSRIRKQAIKDGHLTSKNKLTQTGFLEITRGE